MRSGFIGDLDHAPKGASYYVVFLPSAVASKDPAEKFVMSTFWELANDVAPHTMIVGVADGPGAQAARERFEITSRTQATLIVLDGHPSGFPNDVAAFVVRLNEIDSEDGYLRMIHRIIDATDQAAAVGTLKRQDYVALLKKCLSHLPAVLKVVKVLLPSAA